MRDSGEATMTAKELIKKLKAVYPDTEVIIEGPAPDPEYYPYRKYDFTEEDIKVTCYGELIISVYAD